MFLLFVPSASTFVFAQTATANALTPTRPSAFTRAGCLNPPRTAVPGDSGFDSCNFFALAGARTVPQFTLAGLARRLIARAKWPKCGRCSQLLFAAHRDRLLVLSVSSLLPLVWLFFGCLQLLHRSVHWHYSIRPPTDVAPSFSCILTRI